jgi:hypothetical protein
MATDHSHLIARFDRISFPAGLGQMKDAADLSIVLSFTFIFNIEIELAMGFAVGP